MSKSNYKSQFENDVFEDFHPKRKIGRDEIRRLKRMKNAVKSKNINDLLELDEDLS